MCSCDSLLDNDVMGPDMSRYTSFEAWGEFSREWFFFEARGWMTLQIELANMAAFRDTCPRLISQVTMVPSVAYSFGNQTHVPVQTPRWGLPMKWGIYSGKMIEDSHFYGPRGADDFFTHSSWQISKNSLQPIEASFRVFEGFSNVTSCNLPTHSI